MYPSTPSIIHAARAQKINQATILRGFLDIPFSLFFVSSIPFEVVSCWFWGGGSYNFGFDRLVQPSALI